MLGWDLEGIGKPLSFHMNLADEVLGMAASRKNIWDKCPTCQEFTELVETKVKASHERVLEADLPGSGKDCMMKGGNYEWRFTCTLQTTYSLTRIYLISITTSFTLLATSHWYCILCPTYMLKWVSFLLVVLRGVNVCGFRPQHANGFSWKCISALLRLMSVVAEVPAAKTHSYIVFWFV